MGHGFCSEGEKGCDVIKRPLVVIFVTLAMVIVAFRLCLPKTEEYIRIDGYVEAQGTVSVIEEKASGTVLTLTDVLVDNGTKIGSRNKLLVYQYSESISDKCSNFRNSGNNSRETSSSKLITSKTNSSIAGMRIRLGNRVRIAGKAEAFEEPGNPGQFNAYRYYHEQGYAYSVKADDCEVVDKDCYRIREWLRQFSIKMSEVYKKLLPENEAGIVSAMVLGRKSMLDEDDRDMYQQNGIMHLLAVSGLHVSMISTIILWMISKLPVSFRTGRIAVAVFLLAYGSLAGFSVSTIRALIMICMSILAELAGRAYDMLSAIALSGIVVLLMNPCKLFQSDFLLSFGAVIAIACIAPLLCNCIEVPKLLSGVWSALCVSLSVSMLTTPVILYFYYDAPLYSILLNLLVIPLMSVLFVMALLCGLIGMFAVGAGMLPAGAVHYILTFYSGVCDVSYEHAGNLRITGCPSSITIVLYYVVFAVMLICLKYMNKRMIKLLSFAVLVPMLFLIPVVAVSQTDGLTVTVLDVGQGDGIYIETPAGKVIMVDGGSSSEGSIAKYRLEPFLKYNGHMVIDTWFITHMDGDHYSGLAEELERCRRSGFHIRMVVFPDVNDRENEFAELLRYSDTVDSFQFMSAGERLVLGDVVLNCLHPTKGFTNGEKNEYSLVLGLVYGDFRMLLTGDVEGQAEKALAEKLPDMNFHYDVLKVAHHGSKSSTSPEFLERHDCDVALLSYGKGNRYGHPNDEVVERLREKGIKLYNTVDCGAVTVWSDGREKVIREFKE